MTPEQRMWEQARPLFVGLDPVRVENPADPGTPDVSWVGGWVELKHLDAWPKRATTAVQIDHFTPQQRAWLIRRAEANGSVHLLLRVGREWLLFDGAAAARGIGNWTRAEMCESQALAWWIKRPTWQLFQQVLLQHLASKVLETSAKRSASSSCAAAGS